MSKREFSNIEEEQSGFLTSADGMKVSVGGLMSEKYTNITLLHGSDTSHFKVYSAIRYGKRYILKGISKKYENDPLYQALLAKEFNLGISLDHPNIRRTIGFEQIEGIGNVIVMEYVDGDTLDRYAGKNHLNPEMAMSIVNQMADALEYLERRQILHRDIKPANILITHSGQYVKLIDFSHADAESSVVLKDAAGTNNYIAPEIVGGSALPSVKTDIYSFGMVLRELADSSGNANLSDIAERCCAANAEKRPDSFSNILNISRKNSFSTAAINVLSSKTLTLILILTLIAIWTYIFTL